VKLLADLDLFVEVASARHFGRAAAALDMPASTLSRRIANMEAELGVALINRSTRAFQLTEAGQACFERGRGLVLEAKRIRDDLSENTRLASGHVRVGLTHELANFVLAPIFARFLRDNPGVILDVVTIQGQPNLLSDSLDIAFVVAHQKPLTDSAQIGKKLATFSRALFASGAYLEANGKPKEPRDLARHQCLSLSLGTVQRRWELRRGDERKVIEVRGPCTSTSLSVIARFARENFGVVVLPPFLVTNESFGAPLTRVMPQWEALPGHIYALTVSRNLPAKVARLLEAVRADVGAAVRVRKSG
jgi:DNA-binding transcriptional LysR family regulator